MKASIVGALILIIIILSISAVIIAKKIETERHVEDLKEAFKSGFDEGYSIGFDQGHIDGEHVGYERALKDMRPDPE